MFEVVTIGDAFQDLFVFSKDFKVLSDRSFKSGKSLSFDYGAKLDVEKVEYHSGGSAVNSAIAFSKLGIETGILTFFGPDSAAEKIKSQLESLDISVNLAKSDNQPTNTSIIISYGGDRTILAYHGERNFSTLPLTKSLNAAWFYLSPIGKNADGLENKIIENIAKNGSGLIWNPGPMQISKGARANRHLLHLCNILILNREEALTFSDQGNGTIENCLKHLQSFGVGIVVSTDGKNGAKAFDGERFYKIDCSPDERIDATGAGDAFASTFAAKIISEFSGKKASGFVPEREIIIEALKWGIVNSGAVVSRIGANDGSLSKSALLDRVEKLVKLEAEAYN